MEVLRADFAHAFTPRPAFRSPDWARCGDDGAAVRAVREVYAWYGAVVLGLVTFAGRPGPDAGAPRFGASGVVARASPVLMFR